MSQGEHIFYLDLSGYRKVFNVYFNHELFISLLIKCFIVLFLLYVCVFLYHFDLFTCINYITLIHLPYLSQLSPPVRPAVQKRRNEERVMAKRTSWARKPKEGSRDIHHNRVQHLGRVGRAGRISLPANVWVLPARLVLWLWFGRSWVHG